MGSLQIDVDGRPLTGLVSAKARALLCYLAVTKQPHSRQMLAGLLWPDLQEADARRNLRGDLLKLRQFIPGSLAVTHQSLAFNPDAVSWLDVEVFAAGVNDQTAVPEMLAQTLALYRGDFLSDLHIRRAPSFEQWVQQERTRLREKYLQGCFRLAAAYAKMGNYKEGISCARNLVVEEPLREDHHRQLMELLALGGQRTQALAQYEQCRHLLDQELGIEPMPETIELYEKIKSGKVRKVPEKLEGVNQSSDLPLAPGLQMLNIPSPFIAGPPITHPHHFFGRTKELKRLFGLIRQPPLQNAAIIGPRRSGKTSLLHYLQQVNLEPSHKTRRRAQQEGLTKDDEHRWVFVDFQDPRMGNPANLMGHLLAGLGLSGPVSGEIDQFLDLVSGQLRSPAVIMFDEIGVALNRYPALDDAFWESLRSLATNQVDGNLGFILASAESPGELAHNSGFGSPFFNIFGYTAVLGPLAEMAARELIASSPLPFPAADVEWILTESGRWPILLQILCQERLASLEEGESGETWRIEGRRQAAPFRQNFFSNRA